VRRRLAILFATALLSVFGAVACGVGVQEQVEQQVQEGQEQVDEQVQEATQLIEQETNEVRQGIEQEAQEVQKQVEGNAGGEQ
jgi:hypothetical protein